MKHKQFSLPSERPVIGTKLALLRTGWPLLAALALPPVVGYVWRGITFSGWGWGVVGLLICSGFTFAVWHGLLTRTTESNSQIYDRCERPLGYWLTLAAWFVCYLMSVGAFFFAHGPPNGSISR